MMRVPTIPREFFDVGSNWLCSVHACWLRKYFLVNCMCERHISFIHVSVN